MFAFIIITICYFWFWIYHKNITNVGISARKAAGITKREERELKNSCIWRTVSLFTSLSYNVKKFSWKKKLWVGVIWWLGHFLKSSPFKILYWIQSKQNKVIYYSTTQCVMIWHDNSNIDFKWNITNIMAFTLIAKVSFKVSKSLLYLLFLHNRNNFRYSLHTAYQHFHRTSRFLFLIFWILLQIR